MGAGPYYDVDAFSYIRSGPTQRVRTCPKHTNISIYGMRVHGRCFPSSPKKNGKQQRKKLPAGRKRACRRGGLPLSLSFPARIQRELRRQSDRPPQQYKLRDASARPASCGSTGTAPSLFLMAGRHPGAWSGAGERKAAQIRSGPHELPGDDCRARARCLPVFPRGFVSRLTAAPLCSRVANTEADPHTTENVFDVCGSASL